MWPFNKDSHTQFEHLLKPHLNRLYQLAYRYLGDRDDAEDLVQDLLLKLYPRLEEMQQIEKLGPWLSRVLYRLFIDQYRRDIRSPIDFTDEEDSIYRIHASHDPLPEDIVNNMSTHELLTTALDELKEEYRVLILLHDVEGYNLQEIEEMTGITIGTLKSRLSRSRKKLRKIINAMEPNATTFVLTSER